MLRMPVFWVVIVYLKKTSDFCQWLFCEFILFKFFFFELKRSFALQRFTCNHSFLVCWWGLHSQKMSLFLQAQANCRVGVAALNTLAGYIDWVSMSHITADNCKLLEVLCLLLNEQELQLGAAECLLIAVSRKVSYHSKWISIIRLKGVCVFTWHVLTERCLKAWGFVSCDQITAS